MLKRCWWILVAGRFLFSETCKLKFGAFCSSTMMHDGRRRHSSCRGPVVHLWHRVGVTPVSGIVGHLRPVAAFRSRGPILFREQPVGSIPDISCGNSWLLVPAGWKQVWSVACVCPLASTSHFIGFNKAQRVNSWSQTCADCCLFRFTFVPHTKKSAFGLFVRSLKLTLSLCQRAHFLVLCTFVEFWETLFWI